jgi:hypothetical protein
MQQRLSIAQSVICEPRILLLDEPFGALDPGITADMHKLILDLWAGGMIRKPLKRMGQRSLTTSRCDGSKMPGGSDWHWWGSVALRVGRVRRLRAGPRLAAAASEPGSRFG